MHPVWIRRLLLTVGSLLLASGAACGGSSDEPAGTDAATTTAVPDDTPAETITTPAPDETTTTAPSTTVAVQPAASTIDDLLALDRPIVAAHAGGDQDHPHSTPFAFARSVAIGVDVLEIDVQLTSDGVLVVQHDDTVDRTTNDTGRVADLTQAEIQALDNGFWFAPGFWGDRTRPETEYVYRGVRTGTVEPPAGFVADDFIVPTFRQIAERYPDHVLDIEIKLQRGADGEEDPASGVAAAEVLAREISALGRESSVIVVSFDTETLAAFRALAPGVATSPGLDALTGWFLGTAPLDPADRVLQVPPFFDELTVLTPEFVARAHEEDYAVWAWMDDADTQENAEFYAELVALGVDGLIAGRPAAAVDVALRS